MIEIDLLYSILYKVLLYMNAMHKRIIHFCFLFIFLFSIISSYSILSINLLIFLHHVIATQQQFKYKSTKKKEEKEIYWNTIMLPMRWFKATICVKERKIEKICNTSEYQI